MADSHAIKVWAAFCRRFGVLEQSVRLVASDDAGVVAHRLVGRGETARPVLMRSLEMEALVLAETKKLVDDWESGTHRYDGLIYFVG